MHQFEYIRKHQTALVCLLEQILSNMTIFWWRNVVNREVVNSYSASRDNWCTVGGDGGCRVGEVQAGTTPSMPDHNGFKLQ